MAFRTLVLKGSGPPEPLNAATQPAKAMADRPAHHNGADLNETGSKLEQILQVAAELMALQGFDRTSIRDVARETGYSLAGMYYYFESKEDLLYKIQHRTFAALLAEQEQAVSEGGPAEERLRRLVQNHLSYYTSHFNEMKICTFELQSLEGERYRDIEAIRRRYFKIMAEVVGDILAAGGEGSTGGRRERAGSKGRHYTLFIFGMLNWIFMWFDPERDAPVGSLGEEVVQLVLFGLSGRTRHQE